MGTAIGMIMSRMQMQITSARRFSSQLSPRVPTAQGGGLRCGSGRKGSYTTRRAGVDGKQAEEIDTDKKKNREGVGDERIDNDRNELGNAHACACI